MDEQIVAAGREALAGGPVGRNELLQVAERARRCPLDLFYWARRVRQAVFGRDVKLCAIVPGKLGGCSGDCKWCAQSAVGAAGLTPPQRSSTDDIRQAAVAATRDRASSMGIVNSGREPTEQDLDEVVRAARAVADEPHADLQLCASLGALTEPQARRLAAAGVRRYHHNLETSRRFYPRVVSTQDYDRRIETLAAARAAGMMICCGGLFGLGETWEDRVDLAMALRDRVRPDVVPLNFLVPIPGTPLGERSPMAPLEALTVIAIFRLAMPTTDLKVAGGRETVLRDLQSWIFHAGATSCMVGNYLTTAGRDADADLKMLADLDLRIVAELHVAEDWAKGGD